MTYAEKHHLHITGLITVPLFLLFLVHDKGDIVLAINSLHHPVLDAVFIHLTQLGDGITFLFLALILLTVKFRYTLITALTGGVHALVVGIMKKGFFSHVPRPRNFFDAEAGLNLLNNVDVHGWMSFPSGHTATAFGMALLISLIAKNRIATVLFMTNALLIGFSRMYLLQHFYADVFSGLVIGFLSTLSVWWAFEQISLPAWANRRLMIPIIFPNPGPNSKKAPEPKPSF